MKPNTKHHLLCALLCVSMSHTFTSTESAQGEVSLCMGGDTMLGRGVADHIQRNGPGAPWGDVLGKLKNTDITLVNLETTLTDHNQATPKVFNFKAPPKAAESLTHAGIDVVSIANNHIKDFGTPGLLETVATLAKHNITSVGAGKNSKEAHRPAIFRHHGVTIGMLGYTDNEPEWQADNTTPGTAYFTVDATRKLERRIRRLRKRVDHVVVSLHWGPNMRQRPPKSFQDAAHRLIDAGASIIHGHSAHIFQGVEQYNGGLILYDTGDLVDDYAVDPELRNDQSFLFCVNLTWQKITHVELYPTRINNMEVNFASDKTAEAICTKMQHLSSELGTQLQKTSRQTLVLTP